MAQKNYSQCTKWTEWIYMIVVYELLYSNQTDRERKRKNLTKQKTIPTKKNMNGNSLEQKIQNEIHIMRLKII